MKHIRPVTLLCILLAAVGGLYVGQGTADTTDVQRAAYESGFNSGTCRPLVYEDGSYVLEDGLGQLCVKP